LKTHENIGLTPQKYRRKKDGLDDDLTQFAINDVWKNCIMKARFRQIENPKFWDGGAEGLKFEL